MSAMQYRRQMPRSRVKCGTVHLVRRKRVSVAVDLEANAVLKVNALANQDGEGLPVICIRVQADAENTVLAKLASAHVTMAGADPIARK